MRLEIDTSSDTLILLTQQIRSRSIDRRETLVCVEERPDVYKTYLEKSPDDLDEAMIASTLESGYRATVLVTTGS